MMGVNMDYDSIAKAGSMLGAGSVIIMDDTTCMVKLLARIAEFYYENPAVSVPPAARAQAGWRG